MSRPFELKAWNMLGLTSILGNSPDRLSIFDKLLGNNTCTSLNQENLI